MQGLLIKANMIDARADFIEEITCEDPFVALYNPDLPITPPSYQCKRYILEKYQDRDKNLDIHFFIEADDFRLIKSFLESNIYEAMRATGYEDARRFRQIKEDYGEEFSDLLVKRSKDPVVKQQLMRMLDF